MTRALRRATARRPVRLSPETAKLQRQLKAALKSNGELCKRVDGLLKSLSVTNGLLERLVMNSR